VIAEPATNERVISKGCDELHLVSVESRGRSRCVDENEQLRTRVLNIPSRTTGDFVSESGYGE